MRRGDGDEKADDHCDRERRAFQETSSRTVGGWWLAGGSAPFVRATGYRLQMIGYLVNT
jgi:hypothetical protein